MQHPAKQNNQTINLYSLFKLILFVIIANLVTQTESRKSDFQELTGRVLHDPKQLEETATLLIGRLITAADKLNNEGRSFGLLPTPEDYQPEAPVTVASELGASARKIEWHFKQLNCTALPGPQPTVQCGTEYKQLESFMVQIYDGMISTIDELFSIIPNEGIAYRGIELPGTHSGIFSQTVLAQSFQNSEFDISTLDTAPTIYHMGLFIEQLIAVLRKIENAVESMSPQDQEKVSKINRAAKVLKGVIYMQPFKEDYGSHNAQACRDMIKLFAYNLLVNDYNKMGLKVPTPTKPRGWKRIMNNRPDEIIKNAGGFFHSGAQTCSDSQSCKQPTAKQACIQLANKTLG